jgi:1,4-dihydroxy-2-naphthoyl-CoA hydrolase
MPDTTAQPPTDPARPHLLPGGAGALAEKMGVTVLEAGPERTVATMPVEDNTQPYGLMHGGASVVLGETMGSIAAALHAGPGRIAIGIEVNATHHRAVRAGTVTGVATALHLGGRSATYEFVVTDESGRRVSTGRLTCLLLDSAPAAKGNGST